MPLPSCPSEIEPAFIAALLQADQPVPPGLVDAEGRPARRRFDVYRNNVAASLRRALLDGFPVMTKLLGRDNMLGLGDIYLRRHPPQSPVMMHFGREFPAFLAGFKPLSHLGYLSDVAHLELALRRSYHARDTAPMEPARLSALSPDTLMRCRLRLAPSVEVIPSPWPLFEIWRFNTQDGAPKPSHVAQDVLITRPAFDPIPQPLPPGGAVWIKALQDGACLADATDLASKHTEAFDLRVPLGLLLGGAALVDLITEDL